MLYTESHSVYPSFPLSLIISSQSGWMENHITFVSELKNLQASSLSTFGASLKEAFDLLNVRRLQTGIDHYGQVCDETSTCTIIVGTDCPVVCCVCV